MFANFERPQHPRNVRETINWLLRLGRPPLPECPIEAAKQGKEPKQPCFLDGKYLRLVNWKQWQNTQPIQEIIDAWFVNPKTGIGTLGGWNGKHWLGWVDFDQKDFASPEECDARVNEWVEQYPVMATAPMFRTPSGGYRFLVAFSREPENFKANSGFSLSPDGSHHVGELLSKNGGHTLLPPTVGVSGKPYRWERWSEYPPIVEQPEDVGLYPVQKRTEIKQVLALPTKQGNPSDNTYSALTDFLEREIYPRLSADVAFCWSGHDFKASGDKLRGNCPWHSSQSGTAFYIDKKDGTWLWRCPACEIGGSVIEYRHRLAGGNGSPRGREFVDIVRQLADDVGVSMQAKEPRHQLRLHPDTISEVKQLADIVDVIGEHVVLSLSGKDFVGKCPFHDEKTPSFIVSPTKQTYDCFGCGAAGNVIKFLMELGKHSFSDVVLDLARRYQVMARESDGATLTLPTTPLTFQKRGSGNGGSGSSSDTSNIVQLSEFASAPTSSFDETMERVRQILEIEDEARQAWELGLLAKSIRAFSAVQLLNIYKVKEQNSKPFNPIDVHDFLAQGTDEREWLIAAHISVGTTLVLFADGGVGKTLLAYDLCKAIATGRAWNGFRTRQGKVLIVQTDEPEIDTRERLNIANFAVEIPLGIVQIETNWQFSQIRRLKEWIERERPAFVIIDSFTSANRASQEQEKDANYASCLYELRDIANQYGCSIMVLHHENKLGGSRGTTAIRNNVSEVWRLRKGEPKDGLTPTQRVLEIEKSRSGCSASFKIELNVDDYSWEHLGDFGVEENATSQPLSARLLNYLEARRGVRFEPEELTNEFPGTTRAAIYQHLERHRKKGLINAEERLKQRETGPVRYKVFSAPILDVKVTPQNPEPHTESNLNNLYNQPQQPQQVSRLELSTPVADNSNLDLNGSVEVMSRLDVKVVKVAPDKGLSDSDPNLNNTKVETSFLCDLPTQPEPIPAEGDVNAPNPAPQHPAAVASDQDACTTPDTAGHDQGAFVPDSRQQSAPTGDETNSVAVTPDQAQRLTASASALTVDLEVVESGEANVPRQPTPAQMSAAMLIDFSSQIDDWELVADLTWDWTQEHKAEVWRLLPNELKEKYKALKNALKDSAELIPGYRVQVGNHTGTLVAQTPNGKWLIEWDALSSSQLKRYGEPPAGAFAPEQIQLIKAQRE